MLGKMWGDHCHALARGAGPNEIIAAATNGANRRALRLTLDFKCNSLSDVRIYYSDFGHDIQKM